MRWAGHEARRRREVHRVVWWRNMRERGHLEDLGVDVRMIFKWIFKKWDEGHGLG
jgi:hypothetical protein